MLILIVEMSSEATHSVAMSAIDDTISSSRRVVQDSLRLAKQNHERKLVLEQRMKAFMQKQYSRKSPQRAVKSEPEQSVDAQIPPPTSVPEVRNATSGKDSVQQQTDYMREIETLRTELAQEREWRARFAEVERVLTQRISDQDARIAFLESQLQHKSPDPEDSDLYLSSLHKELTLQRRSQRDWEDSFSSLRLQARRIEELEGKLKASSEKYEDMKRKVTSPRSSRLVKQPAARSKGSASPPANF